MASSADGTSRQRHRLAPRPPAAVYQEVAGVLQSQTTKINGLKTPGAQTSMDDEGACSTTQSLGCRRLSVAVRRCRGHARGQPRGHASMAPFHKGPALWVATHRPRLQGGDYLTTSFGRKASMGSANGYTFRQHRACLLQALLRGQKTPCVALGSSKPSKGYLLRGYTPRGALRADVAFEWCDFLVGAARS